MVSDHFIKNCKIDSSLILIEKKEGGGGHGNKIIKIEMSI